PVLHRWGLVPVRVRLIDGDTVRLPAALLGPLGADFDGDTVALFGRLPGLAGAPPDASPVANPAFLPGKQFRFGLHRLLSAAARPRTSSARTPSAVRSGRSCAARVFPSTAVAGTNSTRSRR